ncbi:MAG: hypothetical protein M0R17_14145 [Candidatus Omnitrophica bacterium]|jgi:hypothetical protein|nr:hypothetical protein [Candidatus Omnitrophota bacterium]
METTEIIDQPKRMKELQETFPLRTEIENSVTAFNKILKDEVKYMPLYILLCNCHPLYRKDYAIRLHKMGKMNEITARKFYYDKFNF